jgi:hypothetical protein
MICSVPTFRRRCRQSTTRNITTYAVTDTDTTTATGISASASASVSMTSLSALAPTSAPGDSSAALSLWRLCAVGLNEKEVDRWNGAVAVGRRRCGPTL